MTWLYDALDWLSEPEPTPLGLFVALLLAAITGLLLAGVR